MAKNSAENKSGISFKTLAAGAAIAALAAFFYVKYVDKEEVSAPVSEAPSPQSVELTANPEKMNEILARHKPALEKSVKLSDYSDEAVRKLAILEDIFEHKNDNDPRMDTDLKTLSNEERRALIERYRTLPKEKRNELGTIIFLLGRNLDENTDFEFLKSVVTEKPCLGLANCNVTMRDSDEGHEHHDSGVDTTLHYPQIMLLQSLIKFVDDGGDVDDSMKKQMIEVAKAAQFSEIPRIKALAQELLGRFGPGEIRN